MRLAALIAWSSTACLGLYLLGWQVRGGIGMLRGRGGRQATSVTRYPVIVIIGHPVLALAGLALWIAFLARGELAYAWAAFGVLCSSVLIGLTLLTQWLTGIGGRHAAQGGGRHVRAWVVVLHGLGGLTTFILVLITATISGHR
ncbi:MAG TPA: hypothetical protein VGI31_05875 [Streptosporangiaceae bacterium]